MYIYLYTYSYISIYIYIYTYLYTYYIHILKTTLKTTSSELSYLELMKPGDVNHVGKKLV